MNKIGFGFLRLPLLDPKNDQTTDYEELNKMVDAFLASGQNYFDTAWTYMDGESENAIRKALVERHPRESFRLADKLPGYVAKSEADSERFFAESLARTGAGYFDVYLVHGVDSESYERSKQMHHFEFVRQLKAEGKVKEIGFSFHDNANVLRQILAEQPGMDYVQLQINYLDWESESVQARKCLEAAEEYGAKVIVMEPVKGGMLAAPPKEAEDVLRAVSPDCSPAHWALRFVQQIPSVEVCLSGMSTLAQVEDNLCDFAPLSKAEDLALKKAARIILEKTAIPCTGCSYCVSGCPQRVWIPKYFKLYNEYAVKPDDKWKVAPEYQKAAEGRGKAKDCIGCGACESVCPQHLPIIENLKKVSEALD
ncbi:MAG: aldo/keto reductase [Firmicutes bacterium]|nr:aldo/keto reductase [Bacillota bacterium]